MMWRGGDAWYHVHLARTSSWRDAPYKYNGTGTIFPGFDRHGIEDPFLYAQPWPSHLRREGEGDDARTYHAIFHDHSTFGGHAFSRDGVSWTYSTTVPFTNAVNYTDGEQVLLQRRAFARAAATSPAPPPLLRQHCNSRVRCSCFAFPLRASLNSLWVVSRYARRSAWRFRKRSSQVRSARRSC